ncbi:MAG: hypothetical protein M1834_006736 [Cirrosporium novae-zelandiae]|nr:MAG: hypothetical protein M1834_006736 [Cirrosporium novae-zelandiae]
MEMSEGSEDSNVEQRPNKWTGPSSTWRWLTGPEKQLAASLETERSRDLSLHLYNAHALRSRLYSRADLSRSLPWDSKHRWRAPAETESNAQTSGFVPPRDWTAWPMPPDEVPRETESSCTEDGSTHTSRLLRDCILGEILRIVKDRFVDEVNRDQQIPVGIGTDSMNVMDHESIPTTGNVEVNGNSFHSGLQLMADDEEAMRRLDIPIRLIGNKLDRVLRGLHETRQTYSTAPGDSSSEYHMENENHNRSMSKKSPHSKRPFTPSRLKKHPKLSSDYGKRVQSRRKLNATPRGPKQITLAHRGRQRERPDNQDADLDVQEQDSSSGSNFSEDDRQFKSRSFKRRGRTYKSRKNRQGSHNLDVKIDNDSAMEKSSDPSASPTHSKSVEPQPRTQHKREIKLGLRDWSDVLGIASLSGFSPAIIQRATRRCSNLFAESMLLRTLHENGDTHIIDFVPGQVEPESPVNTTPNPLSKRLVSSTSSPPPRDSLVCPVLECSRHIKKFHRRYHLKEHIQIQHPELVLSLDPQPSPVNYNDGFLEQIPPAKGQNVNDS